ncbi:MAG: thiamine pyrophosphate-binding protein [Oscillospiraceae bacterium]|nr:thiamine pyrophosphate-binding protein [Oscillospiraceae bacterium]
MNGAEYIIDFLERKNVNIIFGYPGSSVLALYDALYKADKNNIRHILTRHEQGAVHAAEGYAKASGKTGVVFATSGPGAANLVTGLADAMLDSVPVLAVTGQVDSSSLGKDAFQEADMLGVTIAVTKHNYLVKNINDLPVVLEEAWQIASNGRKGPVLVDITKDVFDGEILGIPPAASPLPPFSKGGFGVVSAPLVKGGTSRSDRGDSGQTQKILDLLAGSKRPVILAGGGVAASREAPELMGKFIDKYKIPCVVTLMGKSVIDSENKFFMGMAGMYGLPEANETLYNSDLAIAVGTRFSDRTIIDPELFSRSKTIIHADIDIAEISKNIRADIGIAIDSADFFRALLDFEQTPNVGRGDPDAPWNQILNAPEISDPDAPQKPPDVGLKYAARRGRRALRSQKFYVNRNACNPRPAMREIIRTIVNLCGENHIDNVIVTDVGQHQMLAARETRHKTPGSFITSGGLGTMGFGLPAAIGAAFAQNQNGGKKIILFSGDGGFQMTIQELATVKKTPVPVKIFVLDNNGLGMVRQLQEYEKDGRYCETILEDNPDFTKIADAYNIKSVKIDSRENLKAIIKTVLESDETILVHALTDPDENVI